MGVPTRGVAAPFNTIARPDNWHSPGPGRFCAVNVVKSWNVRQCGLFAFVCRQGNAETVRNEPLAQTDINVVSRQSGQLFVDFFGPLKRPVELQVVNPC